MKSGKESGNKTFYYGCIILIPPSYPGSGMNPDIIAF